jgi:hypothetical protein
MKDYSAEMSRWAALDGDTKYLADRLRKGLMSRDEMAIVADFLEGKIKPRRPRSGQPSRLQNDEMVLLYFHLRVRYPELSAKKIVGKIADWYGVSGRHVYNVLKELDSESRKFHERLAVHVSEEFARGEIARK